MDKLPAHFISCDWGTTNFRLRLVETATLSVRASLTEGLGIKALYAAFRHREGVRQTEYFVRYLSRQIGKLPPRFTACPVVISGMASSNIGLCELPYAGLPIETDGGSLTARWLEGEGRKLLLVSGVYGDDSVMRGEEVQAIGLANQMDHDGLLILPGTHSKHLVYRGGSFTGFATYMTGELFGLLTEHSILAGSVRAGGWNTGAERAFRDGVHQGLAGELSRKLFTVRVRDIVDGWDRFNNYQYLSGLVIGEELKSLRQREGAVYLAASGPLLDRYRVALEEVVPTERLVIFDGEVFDRAVLSAHLKILAYYAN